MGHPVKAFYEEFSRKFVEDVVLGNERVTRQLAFFSRALPAGTRSVLVIGAGSGQGAHFIATTVATSAKVLGLDLSSQSVRLANTLFSHPRITYQQLDVVRDPMQGTWEAIVLPDVYEHIPIESRPVLHAQLNRLLAGDGRILLTIPSPGKQESLRASGRGLQIVDETVTLADLIRLSEDVGGSVTYFNTISVWETNDYVHAVIERGADVVAAIPGDDCLPLKGGARPTIVARAVASAASRLRLDRVRERLLRRRVRRILSLVAVKGPERS